MAKIAFILQGLVIGGMEKGTLYLASRAQEAGHDSCIVLFDVPYESGEQQYDPGSVPLYFLRRRSGFDWMFAVNLAKFVKINNIDVVHAQGVSAIFYSALAVSMLRERAPRLVGTFRNLPYSEAWKVRAATRWATKRAHAVTAVSKELADHLLSTRWVDHCLTIHSGVDTMQFSPACKKNWRAEIGLDDAAFLIGHVGRFDENKRQIDLLRAFRLLCEHIPSAALVFVGDGTQRRPVCLQSVDRERVYFFSRLPDLASFLADLNVFVICSMHEGTPRALLEAMACGCPVVATEVGGIPDVLNAPEGICGITVPPARPDLLAEGIMKLFPPERALNFRSLARKRVVEHFSAESEWMSYHHVYELVLSCGEPRTQKTLTTVKDSAQISVHKT